MKKLKKEKVEKIKKEKPKKIKEPKQPKLKSELPKLDKEVTWEYAHEADLTIGEAKISNTAKVILILLILTLISTGIFGYLKRDYIVDYFSDPQILLTAEHIEIEVGSEFNYKDYLIETEYPERYILTFPDNAEVDTSTLGEYNLTFKLQNLVKEITNTLVVQVVDTTPPELILSEDVITLERGEQTEKFNPEKYIKEVKDNYDKKEDLEILYSTTFDWTKDQVEITYSATDKSGNSTANKLTIVVNDPPKEPEVVYIEKEPEVVYVEQGGNNSSGGTSNSSGNSSSSGSSSSGNSSSSSSNSSSGSSQNSTPPAPSHYINGTRDITVKVGTDFSTFGTMLISGVTSDEYVNVDFGKVNLTVPGSYPVTYSTSNVTKTITVTVTE